MSAIDHAEVRVQEPAAPAVPRPPAIGVRRMPAVLATAFAVAHIPLTALAVATEWRQSGDKPAEFGEPLRDFLVGGSAISGPLMPQLILLTLAALVWRGGRAGAVATAGIGVMGVLVVINGAPAAFADPVWTPRAALIASALFFTGSGLAFIVTAMRALRDRTGS